jgi:arginyl-tRNA synthetase
MEAAQAHNPAVLAAYLYDLAKSFSRFYHDHPIAVAEDEGTRAYRLGLSSAVVNAMKHGLHLLNIPFLEAM